MGAIRARNKSSAAAKPALTGAAPKLNWGNDDGDDKPVKAPPPPTARMLEQTEAALEISEDEMSIEEIEDEDVW